MPVGHHRYDCFVPSRWLRWLRGPSEPNTSPDISTDLSPDISTDLASNFLDMERRLEIVQRAVELAAKLNAADSLVAEWATPRDRAYAATAQYLEFAAPSSAHRGPRVAAAVVARDIAVTSAELDAFYERHRATLNAAAGAATIARARAEEALAGAGPVLQRLAELDAELAGYPSVWLARDQVESARTAVQSALQSGDLATGDAAGQRLRDATTALADAIDAAPERADQARRTLASVRTRLDATINRTDNTDAIFSMLFREFHSDSSADVLDNETRARDHIAAAQRHLDTAASALTGLEPEQAMSFAARAREQLTRAEELVDAVTDRLELLRALRADPTVREREVRFRIRDAQRLAVDRDAVAEWGTALDAQVERVDRIVAALDVVHPDYWKYHLAMEEVSRFVNNIVARIRNTPSTR